MRKSSTLKLILLGILLVSNITVFAYLWLRNGARGSEVTASDIRLPTREVIDDRGKRMQLSSLLSVPVVIQFLDPEIPVQVDSVSTTLKAFAPSEVRFVLITHDGGKVRALLPDLPEEVIVVQHDYAALKTAFRIPECCEQRLIFNIDGNLSYRDYYYEADLIARINRVVKTELPPVSSAVIDVLESCKTSSFTALREQTQKGNPPRALVMLFTSISTTCPSGELLKMTARELKGKDVPLLILVPQDYSDTDRENLRSNFKLNVRVEQFDLELEAKWNKLNVLYGEPRINGSVVVVERGSLSLATHPSRVKHELSQLLADSQQ